MSKNKTQKESKNQGKQLSIQFALNDERFPKLVGLLCLFLTLYLFIAFTSYLFTWEEDFDKAYWNMLFSSEEMSNWLGRLGAIVSHSFFFNGFGIASYIFVGLSLLTGLNLIKKSDINKLFPVYIRAFMLVLASSIFFDFIFKFTPYAKFPWGGAFGEYVIMILKAFVGSAGVAVILIFGLVALLVWNKNPNFNDINLSSVLESIKPKNVINSIVELIRNALSSPQKQETPSEKTSTVSATSNNPIVAVAEEKTEQISENKDKGLSTLRPRPKVSFDQDEFLVEEKHTEEEDDLSLQLNKDKNKPTGQDRFNNRDQSQLALNLNNKAAEEEKSEQFNETNELPIELASENQGADELQMTSENEDHFEPYDPTLELPRFQNPPLELLDEYENNGTPMIDRAELEANKDQIIETLLNYKIEIVQIKATIGPTVTLYEIVPAPGVRISKIKNLEDDIALSLAALGIRIIAPIPGKGTIGIEVPNRNKQMVSLREILDSPKYKNAKMDLPIALGKTISNEVFVADLAKMPHLLIAGATGQGKSVGINTVIMSLLYKKHPSQLKLILIDPKKVELSPYNEIAAHYLAYLPDQEEAIITETSKVVQTLYSLTVEMDERYSLLKKAGVRNITEYNERFVARRLNPENGHRFLPFMVLIVDEFADLIMTAGKEVELPIGRLAQLARAVGIHLIIATQRPSVNIITGVIKANFPARLAFKVASKIDSRTILDAGGAEQLIGRGDMLLSAGSNLLRIQCAFVDTPEVEKVIEHIANQPGYPQPYFLPSYGDSDGDEGGSSVDKLNQVLQDMDEFFEDAARLVVINQSGSTSMIQRRLKLGYNRAGRIMDQLEYAGIVGPNEGSKARNVHFQDEIELEEHLKMLRDKKNKMMYK